MSDELKPVEEKEPERYVVLKASGSQYAYVQDTHARKTIKRYDIFKRNGWDQALIHAKRLNEAAKATP
ncbi:hypothetical protein FEE59_13550 [Herbaspirillum sp. RU 5E]|nr:hypothetical protein [Herbaspirillum sp. RU 5E]